MSGGFLFNRIFPDQFYMLGRTVKVSTFSVAPAGKSTRWRTDSPATIIIQIIKLITTLRSKKIDFFTLVQIFINLYWRIWRRFFFTVINQLLHTGRNGIINRLCISLCFLFMFPAFTCRQKGNDQ